MLNESLVDRIEFSEYWAYSPEEKFALYEVAMPDDTVEFIRGRFADEAIFSRNRPIWSRCKEAGIEPADLQAYFGGNLDHLRRSLGSGRVSDQILWIALELAGLNPSDHVISPGESHRMEGLSGAAVAFRHQCETSGNPFAQLVRHSKSDAARVSVNKLSRPHASLMYTLCRDNDVLDKWIHLAVPVALDFRLMTSSRPLVIFVDTLFNEAAKLLAPDDIDSRSLLKSWAPDVADPIVTLGRIAEAWNPYQLYFHFTQNETRF